MNSHLLIHDKIRYLCICGNTGLRRINLDLEASVLGSET